MPRGATAEAVSAPRRHCCCSSSIAETLIQLSGTSTQQGVGFRSSSFPRLLNHDPPQPGESALTVSISGVFFPYLSHTRWFDDVLVTLFASLLDDRGNE